MTFNTLCTKFGMIEQFAQKSASNPATQAVRFKQFFVIIKVIHKEQR